MLQLLRSLAQNRSLLRNFVVRDLRARYVGSSLGFFWSVIFPVLNLAIYMLVFQVILKMSWAGKSAQEVVLLMLVAIVAWSAFSEAISRSTNVLVDNQNLIEKVVFPSEILPAFVTLSAMINMLIAMPVVLAALVWAMLNPSEQALATGGGVHLGPNAAWLPVLLLLQTVFTAGLGYFFATFNLFWRDTFHVIGVFLTVWMFMTPIFYAPVMMVDQGFGWMLQINPMHWLMDMYRGALVQNVAPAPADLGRFGLASVAVLAIGATFFARQRARFPDLL
ncbi:MAG: ABC transporter permease [Planctomycetota bacterium]